MIDEAEKKEVSSIKYADKRREDNRYGFKLTIEDGPRK
jgi:hypothetical protein